MADAAAERAFLLDAPIRAVRARAEADAAFRHVTGSLGDGLAHRAAAPGRDPAARRLDRAFHAVHVPRLPGVLPMLEEIDAMASVTPQDRDRIDASPHRACRLAVDARALVERRALDAALVDLPAASRLGTVPTLASNLGPTPSGAVPDGVARPIEMRLRAGGSALR